MIEVSWDGRMLIARGHSTSDSRVCSAMSCIAATLFVSYGSSEPIDGELVWDSSSVQGTDVSEFILNFVRALVRQYPEEIVLKEVQQSAA